MSCRFMHAARKTALAKLFHIPLVYPTSSARPACTYPRDDVRDLCMNLSRYVRASIDPLLYRLNDMPARCRSSILQFLHACAQSAKYVRVHCCTIVYVLRGECTCTSIRPCAQRHAKPFHITYCRLCMHCARCGRVCTYVHAHA